MKVLLIQYLDECGVRCLFGVKFPDNGAFITRHDLIEEYTRRCNPDWKIENIERINEEGFNKVCEIVKGRYNIDIDSISFNIEEYIKICQFLKSGELTIGEKFNNLFKTHE